jgi:hypothetical protein
MNALLLAQSAMAAVVMNFSSLGAAVATPMTPNSLGAVFVVLTKGSTSTVEITLHPAAPFESVKVESGSGVATLSPPCSFSGVVVGATYTCKINVTQASQESSLTLNVVGQTTMGAGRQPIVEVSHFTIANDTYVAPAVNKSRRLGPALTHTPDQKTTK